MGELERAGRIGRDALACIGHVVRDIEPKPGGLVADQIDHRLCRADQPLRLGFGHALVRRALVVGMARDQIPRRVGLVGRPGEIGRADRALITGPLLIDTVDRVEILGLEPGAGSVVPPPVVAGLGVGACVELSKNDHGCQELGLSPFLPFSSPPIVVNLSVRCGSSMLFFTLTLPISADA